MIFANMHNHSCFSDAAYTPEELVELAKTEGYGGVILTDHDTVRGTYFMQKAARKAGLLTFLGCEFSTKGLGSSFHLLGFDFNPELPEMKALLRHVSQKSTQRTRLLFQWAVENGTLKDITWDEVLAAYPFNDYFCNDQVAVTMRKKGLMEEKTAEFKAAFSYKDKDRETRIKEIMGMDVPNVIDVIKIVRKAGGVPVLAHPSGQLEYVEKLVEEGLMGVEANHPSVSEEETKELHNMADKMKLYKTGGTDHSGVLGGFACIEDDWMSHEQLFACGAQEEDFMKLYRRELG